MSHCGSGNVIDLYALLSERDPNDKTQFRETALEMQEVFLGDRADQELPPRKRAKSPEKNTLPKPLAPNPPLTFSLNLKPDVPFLLEEKKLDLETIEELGIGWCNKGILNGRIAIPIHDANGQCVAYVGRRFKDGSKTGSGEGRWFKTESSYVDSFVQFVNTPNSVEEGKTFSGAIQRTGDSSAEASVYFELLRGTTRWPDDFTADALKGTLTFPSNTSQISLPNTYPERIEYFCEIVSTVISEASALSYSVFYGGDSTESISMVTCGIPICIGARNHSIFSVIAKRDRISIW